MAPVHVPTLEKPSTWHLFTRMVQLKGNAALTREILSSKQNHSIEFEYCCARKTLESYEFSYEDMIVSERVED